MLGVFAGGALLHCLHLGVLARLKSLLRALLAAQGLRLAQTGRHCWMDTFTYISMKSQWCIMEVVLVVWCDR